MRSLPANGTGVGVSRLRNVVLVIDYKFKNFPRELHAGLCKKAAGAGVRRLLIEYVSARGWG